MSLAGVDPEVRACGAGRALCHRFFRYAQTIHETEFDPARLGPTDCRLSFISVCVGVQEPDDAMIDGVLLTESYLTENNPKILFRVIISRWRNEWWIVVLYVKMKA
jgi:hypothetical protein